MNIYHLLWIVPLTIILTAVVSFLYGMQTTVEAIAVMENISCQMCVDGFELCMDIMSYTMEYNGTTDDAINSYRLLHNDSLMQLKNKYNLPSYE